MNANREAGEFISAGASRAQALCLSVSLLNAIGVGAILPQIFFVNDLGHPLQNGLLLSLMPAGRLVGKYILPPRGEKNSGSWQLILQGIALTIMYLLFAASAEFYPTGIFALRLTQLIWFLFGLFGSNLLFQRRYSNDNFQNLLPISAIGIAVGALVCSVLSWTFVRSPERYDMAGLLRPAVAAAVCSALAVLLISIGRCDYTAQKDVTPADQHDRRETPKLFLDVLATGNSSLRSAIYVSAGAACATAIACMLAPLMLWESFAFTPGAVALTIAGGGLIAVSIHFLIARMLLRSRSIFLVGGFAAIGLLLLGVSVIPMMWAPGAASLSLAIAGCVILSVAVGFLQSTLSNLISLSCQGSSCEIVFAANEVAHTLAWIIGPILCTSIFYAHERTSFALSGVMIGLTAAPFINLWWKRVRVLHVQRSKITVEQ